MPSLLEAMAYEVAFGKAADISGHDRPESVDVQMLPLWDNPLLSTAFPPPPAATAASLVPSLLEAMSDHSSGR